MLFMIRLISSRAIRSKLSVNFLCSYSLSNYFLIRINYVMQKCGTTASHKTSRINSILNSSKSDHTIIITAFNRSIFTVATVMLSPAIMPAVKERYLCPITHQFVQPNFSSALAEAHRLVADRGPTETYM